MAAEQTKTPSGDSAPVTEKQTNCLGCGKPIKKLKRYYRNGKFYCNKKCWSSYLKKPKEEKK